MTDMGEELWLEFGCAAEARGLNTGFVERMIDDGSIFNYKSTADQLTLDASAESWLLAIHALYDESRPEISRFLVDYRERHANRLRYEFLTTDGSKRQLLESITVRGSGEWIGPAPPLRLKPIWSDRLRGTIKCRHKIREELLKKPGNSMSEKYTAYLRRPVTWNPDHNPIEQDAIWVRRAGQ